ncbi:hypothetical protein [Achromobacter aloeverae]
MTVRCIECRLFTLQKHEGMARQGFGKCALDADDHPGRFNSAVFPRHCQSHAAALPPVVASREQWLAQVQADFVEEIRGAMSRAPEKAKGEK